MSKLGRRIRREKVKQKTKISDAHRTAYHEAGHAVADALLGVEYDHVSPEPFVTKVKNDKGEELTLQLIQGIQFAPEHRTAYYARIDANDPDVFTGLAAGYIAECLFVGGRDDRANEGATTDFHVIPEEHRDGAEKRALELVPENWEAVRAVAHFLDERRSLDFQEVCAIIEAARGLGAKDG